ncbi:MAG: TIGR03118 family protein [Rhizomicrobium sp.]
MRTEIKLALGLLLLASPAFAAGSANRPAATSFKVVKLVANKSGKAKNTDANLVDAWGLSQAPGGPVWVSDNGTGLSTVYDEGTGTNTGLVVTIPGGFATGQAYVPLGTGFKISENGKSGNAEFLFDSEAGMITGWSSAVDEANAVVAYDGSGKGSVYKGLALDPSSKLLFAADFANDQVQIFDSSFNLTGSFTDKNLKGYGPFNVAIVNGNVYVAFAKQDKTKHDEVDRLGLGYVDVFSEQGTLIKQLVAKGELDAPWGLAIAPSTFGSFAGSLLVGNFGNGWINAYDPNTGSSLGWLSDKKGNPLAIQGLWALDPVPSGEMTFSAGPHREKNGLLGLIKAN